MSMPGLCCVPERCHTRDGGFCPRRAVGKLPQKPPVRAYPMEPSLNRPKGSQPGIPGLVDYRTLSDMFCHMPQKAVTKIEIMPITWVMKRWMCSLR